MVKPGKASNYWAFGVANFERRPYTTNRKAVKTVITREELEEFIEGIIGGEKT